MVSTQKHTAGFIPSQRDSSISIIRRTIKSSHHPLNRGTGDEAWPWAGGEVQCAAASLSRDDCSDRGQSHGIGDTNVER